MTIYTNHADDRYVRYVCLYRVRSTHIISDKPDGPLKTIILSFYIIVAVFLFFLVLFYLARVKKTSVYI